MPAMFAESTVPSGPIGDEAANLIALLLLEAAEDAGEQQAGGSGQGGGGNG
jgi:hypothetical protein